MIDANLAELSYMHGRPQVTGSYKQQPSDFQVTELLDVTAEDEGEHQWLWVYKKGANTTFVARQLAEFAGVSERSVSYAGLKDRQAETWQWFSVQLPGKALLDWQQLDHPEFRVERAFLRSKKLKMGLHQGNAFRLRLRQVSDVEALQERWQQLVQHGVPNYFGEQRFGRDGQNLVKAEAWLTGEISNKKAKKWSRQQQGMLLSSIRSYLFNTLLSQRIEQQRLTPETGDFMLLSGTRSFFQVEQLDDTLIERWRSGDIHLSGPLPGGYKEPWQEHLSPFEHEQLQGYQNLVDGLRQKRVDLARRRLLLNLEQAAFECVDTDTVDVMFSLPTGSFATSVLRELMQDVTEDEAV
ncbi:tRNA pseudouridine(13) synthase TruD [Pseudidiomarina homiensis]|uniref:tRNA pseudouridine synthase D n=1 Tax=Pseudidiomarina homiensis TaxID=364198 RepID=A0A432Y4A3_9GAMM|nr:tRNA pseudouridine(13) synthase TruD [Pseudidiomarina homiensis]RUO55799.1 tRNA pseudouridine(13) synthase TruD [Pseudidiomarina homiensis]